MTGRQRPDHANANPRFYALAIAAFVTIVGVLIVVPAFHCSHANTTYKSSTIFKNLAPLCPNSPGTTASPKVLTPALYQHLEQMHSPTHWAAITTYNASLPAHLARLRRSRDAISRTGADFHAQNLHNQLSDLVSSLSAHQRRLILLATEAPLLLARSPQRYVATMVEDLKQLYWDFVIIDRATKQGQSALRSLIKIYQYRRTNAADDAFLDWLLELHFYLSVFDADSNAFGAALIRSWQDWDAFTDKVKTSLARDQEMLWSAVGQLMKARPVVPGEAERARTVYASGRGE